MKIKLIASISGIELKETEHINIPNVKIVHGSTIVDELNADRELLVNLGTFEANQIVKAAVIYYEGELSNFPGTINRELNVYEQTRQFHNACTLIFKCFWHDVDNNINVEKVFIMDCETKEFGLTSFSGMIYNSSCNIEKTAFPQETTSNTFNFYKFRIDLLEKSSLGEFEQKLVAEDFTSGVPVYIPSPPAQYNHSRLLMAFTFLDILRSQAMIQLRIAFNMVMYESLFCSSQDQISKQIRERLTFYLQDTKERTSEIKRLIKQSYDVRSRFFHGDKLERYSHEKLVKMSKDLDDLNRQLYQKILGDSSLFERDKVGFDEYFSTVDTKKPWSSKLRVFSKAIYDAFKVLFS